MAGHRESDKQNIFHAIGRMVLRSPFVGADDAGAAALRRDRSVRDGGLPEGRIPAFAAYQLS